MTGCWGLTSHWRMEGEANRLGCVLLGSAGSMRGCLSHASCMCQLEGWAQTAASRMDNGGWALLPTAAGKGGSGK